MSAASSSPGAAAASVAASPASDADSCTFLYKAPARSSAAAAAISSARIPSAGWDCFAATASPAPAVFGAWLRSKLGAASSVAALYDPRTEAMMSLALALQRGALKQLDGATLFVVTEEMQRAAAGGTDAEDAAAEQEESSDAEESEDADTSLETATKTVAAAPAPTPLFSLRTPSGAHHPVLLSDLAPLVELRAYTRSIPLPLLWGMLQHVLSTAEDSEAPRPMEPGALVALVHALVQHVASKTPQAFPAALWEESARISASKSQAGADAEDASTMHVPSSVTVSLLRLYELCCLEGGGPSELDQESLIAALILMVRAESTMEQLHLAWSLFNEDDTEDQDEDEKEEQSEEATSARALALAARESLSIPQFQRFLRATLLPSALALTKRAGSLDSVMGWIRATVEFVTSNLCSLFDLAPAASSASSTAAAASSAPAAAEPRISFLHLLQFQRSYPNILAFLTVNDTIQARMEKHIALSSAAAAALSNGSGGQGTPAASMRNARGPPLSAGTGATGRGPLSPLHEASGEEDDEYASRSPLDSSADQDDGRDLFTSDDGMDASASAAEGSASESAEDEAPVADAPDSPLFSFANSALPSESVSLARSASLQSQASTQSEVQPTPAPSRSVSGAGPTATAALKGSLAAIDEFTSSVLVNPATGASLSLDPSHMDLLCRVLRPLAHLSVSALLSHLQQYEEAPRGEIAATGFKRAVQEMMREQLQLQAGAAGATAASISARSQSSLSHLLQIHSLFDVDHSGSADLIELCVGLCTLCGGSSAHEQLRFAFDLFDSDGDEYLTRNEVLDLMIAMLRPLLPNAERGSQAFLQDLVSLYVPALFEGARAFQIDASEESGSDEEDAASPRGGGPSDRGGREVISFREFVGMLALFGSRVPFVSIIQRLLDPSATALFGAGAGFAATAGATGRSQQQSQQQASPATAQRQRKQWDLSNRAVVIPRLAQSSDDDNDEDEQDENEDDAAQDSDASRSSFHGSLYSASPLSSYPASPTLQSQAAADPSDSCASDLEAYNASREKRIFQATHRFPSYDEFRATGDASARPKSAAAAQGQAQAWMGSLSSDGEEMSPAKEHRAFHQAALRLASEAAHKARGAQASQAQFATWKQGVDQRRATRTDQAAAYATAAAASAAAARGSKPVVRKEAWSTSSAPTHSSPSRPATKRVRLDDDSASASASASALRDFNAASKDPSFRLGLFQLFKHQQQAKAVQVAASACGQPSTQRAAASAMSARPGTAPAPLSLAATSNDGSAGFAKWASAVTPRGSSESRRLQQGRSTEDRPSTAAAAAATAQAPLSSPTFQPGRPTLPTRIALFTSAAASEAAAAAGLPVRLTFSVEDLTRLHALLKLLASLQPPGYSFLTPAAVVLKRLEPSLLHSTSAVPIASADAFYRGMHFLLSATPAGSATPSGHLIDHLIACCFVGFQCETASGAAEQAGGAMRIQDFLLAITAWCSNSGSGGNGAGGSSMKGKWAASFQMLLSEGRGRITRSQLAHLFECCVRFLLCTHDALQAGLGRRGFSELVSRVVESSVAAFFPIADAADRGSISFGDFTRVMSRYPTLVPWLQVMHDAQQRAAGGRQHSSGRDEQPAQSFDASSSADDSFASASASASASPDASASDSDYDEAPVAALSPFVDSASSPILSVDLRPALSAEALENFPQAVDGAVLAQAVSADEALLQLSERDIYEFALARSLARDVDSQSLVAAVRAFPHRSAGLTAPLFSQLLLNHIFGDAASTAAAPSSIWLREEFTRKLFLVLQQDNGRVQPTDLILALHSLLPSDAAAQGSDENLRAAWNVLASQSPQSQQSGCLTSSQVERLLSSSLKLLLCFDPNAWGLSARGDIEVQPDIPLLITLLSRLATHNLFALANVRLDRSGSGRDPRGAGAGVQHLLAFDEFARVFYSQPTLMPWLEVISGLVQGEEITQQQQMQQQYAASSSGSEEEEENEAEYRARQEYEQSRRAQGYMSLSDAEDSEYGSSIASSSPSSPALSSQESALLRAALASSSTSPPRAQSNGNKREDPRRALFNRWREQASPQKQANAQGRAQQRQQQQQGNDAIHIQITPEPQEHLQRAAAAAAASNGRSPSPLQAALNSRRSSSSSSASSASHSSADSLSTPTRRGNKSASKSKSKAKKIGPHTLSVDPFSVTLALHQNPSPRALLSAIKVKPLPVFTLPSHAPKLLLCIPLHSERHGASPTSKADSSSVTSPYGESAQSIKVYDADLPAFTFFKAHLRGMDGNELYRRCVGIARSAAWADREDQRESDAMRVLHCRLTRLEFAAAFKELLSGPGSGSGSGGSGATAAESADSVGGLDGPLHSYAISLFRCLDHESRGSVMLMELALALSLFLGGDHPSKLAFAMRMLDAEGEGVSESNLAIFYRAIYSLLSALCATHFRMSVPSRPPSPASAPHLRAGGPLSPSSLHSLPHEMMQERLQATARAQSSEMMRLAGLPATPSPAATSTERRIQPAEFLRISAANPHLLSFLHCINLDETFSPRSKQEMEAAASAAAAAENRQRQSAVQEALNSAASPRSGAAQMQTQSWVARSPRGAIGSGVSGGSAAPLGTLRQAHPSDLPALELLMKGSARGLGKAFYSPRQNRSFEEHVAIPDAHLIEDGTYFLIELPTTERSGSSGSSGSGSGSGASGEIIACGGWSRRDKLFRGNDAAAGGIDRELVPGRDAARVRAMFVAPTYARRGLGKRILAACEAAARAEGFTRAELMATLPGVPLYKAAGYQSGDPFDVMLPDGVALPCIRMSKSLVVQEGAQNGSGSGSGSASGSSARATAAASISSPSDLRSPSESEGEEIVVPNTQGRAAAAAQSFSQPMGSPTSMPTDLPSVFWSA